MQQPSYHKLITALASVSMLMCTANVGFGANQQQTKHTKTRSAQPAQLTPAQALGWVPAKNFCGGYYTEPKIVSKYPEPKPAKQQQTSISADRYALLSPHGRSILIGNVKVAQKGREVTANKAYLFRNQQGKITQIKLYGNVHFLQAGKTLVAQKAFINTQSNTWTLYNVVYRMHQTSKFGDLEGWGQADTAWRPFDKIFNVTNGTYSTCAPTKRIWSIKARHLHLDKQKNRGTVTNAFLRVHHVPIFYLPYWNFPINKERKTGFLNPTFSYSDQNGAIVEVPFYWNMAPNFDETFYPRYISQRGIYVGSLFRFLTPTSTGQLRFDVIPNDRKFRHFKNNAASSGSDYKNHALHNLQKASNNRLHFMLNDTSRYNIHWQSQLHLNYVSDDYFFQDFGSTPNNMVVTQLPESANMSYADPHWHYSAGIFGYQTLHPLNQDAISNQYWRLPDLTATGNYPNEKFGLDYALNSELVHFAHASNFATGNPIVTGNRIHVQPSISLPIDRAAGYITPTIQYALTDYSLTNPGANNPSQVGRSIPIYNIDSGLYFERRLTVFNRHYTQTLQPRLFYLYVPYRNQDDIPDFDTTLPTFSYGDLFSTNRFIGYDRIGDANQLAFGVTSDLLDAYTGTQKMSLGLGTIHYFQKNQVCLSSVQGGCDADPSLRYDWSPLVGETTYHFDSRWSGGAKAAWEMNEHQMENWSANLKYQTDNTHTANIGYQFVRDGELNNKNYSRINLSAGWELTQHWLALGAWDYNITEQFPQTYLYGLEYNSCCWAIRIVRNKSLIAIDNGSPIYDKRWYIQLQLKGLTNFSTNNPTSLLADSIKGYQDKSWR